MSVATTSTVTTFAGCLAQLNSITNGIDMIPSRLCEETIYVPSSEAQEDLPELINLDGSRTGVADVFDRAFPVARAAKDSEDVVRSSQVSSFVRRVKALDSLLDRDVEDVMLGLTNRPPNTFDSYEAWKEFDRFIIGVYGRARLRDVMKADGALKVMADESFETAKLADRENRPEAVANAFFISGRLYAAMGDVGMSYSDAAVAFEMAAPLFESAKRYVASAICYELMAQMRELRGRSSEGERLKASSAWLKAVRRARELKVDSLNESMVIFRGLWNAYRAGEGGVQTAIPLLELSAEMLFEAGMYARAADDYVRILNYTLPMLNEAERGDWRVVEEYLEKIKDCVRRTESPSDLLQDLIDLGNDAHENRVRA